MRRPHAAELVMLAALGLCLWAAIPLWRTPDLFEAHEWRLRGMSENARTLYARAEVYRADAVIARDKGQHRAADELEKLADNALEAAKEAEQREVLLTKGHD